MSEFRSDPFVVELLGSAAHTPGSISRGASFASSGVNFMRISPVTVIGNEVDEKA
jgi:hypothetical protein